MRTALLGLVGAVAVVVSCVSDDSGQPDGSMPDATSDGTSADGGSDAASDVAPDVSNDTGPPRYCATQSPPDGSADFTCADFDGTNLGEGFTDASVDDASSLAANPMAFVSSPNSLLAQTPATSGGNVAYYFWQKPGGTRVHTITLTMSVNPFPTGTVPPAINGEIILATMPTSVGGISFGYTRNNTTANALHGYVGFFVLAYRTGMVPTDQFTEVAPLTENIWTEVSFTLDEEALTMGLTYDGASQLTSGTIPFSATETVATVDVGTQTLGEAAIFAFRYDNVRISTTRDP